jgi:ribosomal protein S18 acetylase RimI-like enzyme
MIGDVIKLRDTSGGAGAICRSILDLLPSWFGIPESVDHYVERADLWPSIIASTGDEDIGITTVKHHNAYASEVFLIAVHPAYHRRGVGRAMLQHLESELARRGVEFLQVKTLSASRPDVGYDKTRAFYLAYGFRPLEEFPLLWDSANPALQLVKSVSVA